MARTIYAEINLHITWHTKDGASPTHGDVESRLHGYLRNRAVATDGVRFHAVGGMPDHVHLAVSVPPTLQISEWIGELKGASAHHVNHEVTNRKVLEWQTGYGVVSFGTKDLPWVVRYVERAEAAAG
jgi:putative transposase